MKSGISQDGFFDDRFRVTFAMVLIVLFGALIYAFIRISDLNKESAALSSELASTTSALYGNTTVLAKSISDLKFETLGIITTTQQELAATKENITAVKNQVGGVEQTLGSVSGTVSTLQKLSTIDSELLKKYSKVYFLNENFTPAHLTVISQGYVYSNTTQEEFLAEAWPFLQRLLNAAKAEGVTLYIKSAYRSFSEQQALKSEYSVIYGSGTANSFSADQGYSEHQLGTATDFITPGLGGELIEAFDTTPAFQWLRNNAHKYGFELSYPKGNNYYIYEPWHWRFVGVKLATYLHDQNKNFYDIDQRDIDTYLANFFD